MDKVCSAEKSDCRTFPGNLAETRSCSHMLIPAPKTFQKKAPETRPEPQTHASPWRQCLKHKVTLVSLSGAAGAAQYRFQSHDPDGGGWGGGWGWERHTSDVRFPCPIGPRGARGRRGTGLSLHPPPPGGPLLPSSAHTPLGKQARPGGLAAHLSSQGRTPPPAAPRLLFQAAEDGKRERRGLRHRRAVGVLGAEGC